MRLPSVLVYCCLFSQLFSWSCDAWRFWPMWAATGGSTEKKLPTLARAQKDDLTEVPSRPCKFQAPYELSKRRSDLLAKESSASVCRYELAKRLLDGELNACASQTAITELARIAAVCHYQMSNREDRLPVQCFDESCVREMSPEVFQVFTTFQLHAESICRELNAKMWMDSIESLITDLGTVGDETLERLQAIKSQNVQLFRITSLATDELVARISKITNLQSDHFELEQRSFNMSKQALESQQLHLNRFEGKLNYLHEALSGFDHMAKLVNEIRDHQKASVIYDIVTSLAFYACFLYSLRIIQMFSAKFQKDSLDLVVRSTCICAFTSCVCSESLARAYNQVELWTVRNAHIAALHALVFTITVLHGIRKHCSAASSVEGTHYTPDDTVFDLLQDIVALKNMVPTSSLNNWTASPTLSRLLMTAPEGYRAVNPAQDGDPLPEAWYRTAHAKLPLLTTIKVGCTNGSLFDEANGMDFAHCIVAID